MSPKSLGILVAITLVLVAAAFLLTRQEPDGIPSRGERVFPGLLDRLNEARRVTITSAQGEVTLALKGDRWVVEDKHDYPAALDKLRPLLIGLAELRVLEPKTRNPELYAKLGLHDPSAPDSPARALTVRDADGGEMATLILGNHRRSRADASRDELYVRKPGDPQTWLALGRLRPEKTAEAWLDRQILDLDMARVRQVRVEHPDGSTVLVRKPNPTAIDFELVGLPANAEVRSQFSVNNLADQMAHVTLEDVVPRGDVAFPRTGVTTVRLETFDGLRVTLKMVEQDGRHRAVLSAEFDRALVHGPEPEVPEGREEEEDGTEGPASGLQAPEVVQQEAEALNAELGRWVYVLPRFRAEALAPRKDSLLASEAKKQARAARS